MRNIAIPVTLGLLELSTENYETKIARLLLFSDWAEF